MYYQKKGMPTEGDLVVCTVTKIHPTSVFAKLEHYDNKSGMLHISEIAPGRIRNLKEYVSEGKTIVCQVLKVNEHRNHIDLSLRRVSDARKVKKISEIKQELKAEKIVDTAAEELKADAKKLYDQIAKKVFTDYAYLHEYFMDLVKGDAKYSLMGLAKEEQVVFEKIISQRIKPPMMEIKGIFGVKSFTDNGTEVIIDLMKKVQKVDKNLIVTYGGGGNYPFRIITETFEDAEGVLKKALDLFADEEKNKTITFSFKREEGKQIEA